MRRPWPLQIAGMECEQPETQPLRYPPAGLMVGVGEGPANAVRSPTTATATMAHQIRFWSRPCRSRLRIPVPFACRMRSSQLARRRCRS